MRIVPAYPAPTRPAAAFLDTELTPEMWHRMWAEADRFVPWYPVLVRSMASHLFEPGAPYLYQREPNLRIHPPGGVAVPWHTDADFGHLPQEWNLWVPLTETTDDSQRLWVEEVTAEVPTGPAKGTPTAFQQLPVPVRVGEVFIFRGAVVRHGNQVNTTDTTRVSFDFRLILKKHYRDTGAKTVLYGVPLRLGDYWEEMR